MAIQSSAALQTLLNQIHRKSYPAYKETKGIYQFDHYVLSIDHVQGDPFVPIESEHPCSRKRCLFSIYTV